MSFEEMANIWGEQLRVVHLNPPMGSWKFPSTFSIMKGCGEATHVLGLFEERLWIQRFTTRVAYQIGPDVAITWIQSYEVRSLFMHVA